jgi:probable HAF family extracellular repeat protein
MKLATLKSVFASAVLVTLTVSLPVVAQVSGSSPSHYSVINLGTLGGSASNGYGGVNNRGWVTGDANLSGDQTEHAFLWRDGVMTDLGTLGGLNSSVPTPVKDDKGLVVGGAQSATVDPLGEFWGAAYFCTANNCQGWQNLQLGFIWRDGVMSELQPIGGNNSEAFGINNRGQAVGIAETAVQDANCVPPQVRDFEAVIWEPKEGEIQELPMLPGDAVAAALAINDKGQVVGTSGSCAVPDFLFFSTSAFHAVLWQNGSVIDLGSFGGLVNNSALAINNAGQVVGMSDLPGDTTTHAFFLDNGLMTDLGTLPGDFSSTANDINSKGQVVGSSCDVNFNCRAFLWEKGVMTDLNTLIPPDTELQLISGEGINDRGEISGTAFDPNTGESPAFLAIPCDKNQAGDRVCQDAAQSTVGVERPKVVLPKNARERLRHFRLGMSREH